MPHRQIRVKLAGKEINAWRAIFSAFSDVGRRGVPGRRPPVTFWEIRTRTLGKWSRALFMAADEPQQRLTLPVGPGLSRYGDGRWGIVGGRAGGGMAVKGVRRPMGSGRMEIYKRSRRPVIVGDAGKILLFCYDVGYFRNFPLTKTRSTHNNPKPRGGERKKKTKTEKTIAHVPIYGRRTHVYRRRCASERGRENVGSTL